MRNILSKMRRNFTGQTLARIAVEVCEEKDVKLLVESRTVDWNQRAEGEDPAIFWALNNKKLNKFKILLKCPELDLRLRSCDGHSLEKVARDWFHETGQEEFKEILKIIPGTVEYENKVQAEVIRVQIEINKKQELKNRVQIEINKQQELKIRQLEQKFDRCVKKVTLLIN